MEVGPLMLNSKNIAVLIPCRYNSRRLPGKALKKIGSKPLIHHVFQNTLNSLKNIDIKADVAVCTDSELIIEYLEKESIPFYQTSSNPINGTERIAEAIKTYNLEYEYYIDVQGDEPFINNEILLCVKNSLFKYKSFEDIIILPHQEINFDEAERNSIVKLVLDNENFVMYMSRSLIPYVHLKEKIHLKYKKHLSVIGFTKKSIDKYSSVRNGEIQILEDIELLKALESGTKIFSPLSTSSTFSIDTNDDLEKARKMLIQNNA